MTIDFSADRWDRLIDNTDSWWDGTLERPLIALTVEHPGRRGAAPHEPYQFWTSRYDFDTVPAEAVVDNWDWHLSGFEFLGDAYPNVFNNFGPGVIAAFLDCEAGQDANTVWFHPTGDPKPLPDTHITARWDRSWYKRVDAITKAACDRWADNGPICSFTDLGGNLDIIASYRPSELLLYDLYDAPQAVERVTWEAHDAWWAYYNRLHGYMAGARGTTSWAGIFSSKRTYMTQCDFCYMISPDMFDRFVKPEIAATCTKLDHSFYHLDGVGQLPHLDSLLEIDALHGVQWIPGDGQPNACDWPDVYRRILGAGKLAQYKCGTLEEFRTLVDKLGTAKGFQLDCHVTAGPELHVAIDILESLGVPV